MGDGQYQVIALLSSQDGKNTGCRIIPTDQFFPAIFRKVFGPASREACERYVNDNCAQSQEELVGALSQQPVTVSDLIGHHARVYETGEALTQDFRPDRVNIELSEDSVIRDIWFG